MGITITQTLQFWIWYSLSVQLAMMYDWSWFFFSFYYIANRSFYFPRNMRSHLKFQFGVLLYTTLNKNTIHEGQNRNFIFILQILAVPFSKSCHLNFNRRNFFFLSIVLKGLAMIIVFWDKNNWKNTRRIWS